MEKLRIIYDFDGTLSPKFMQEYGLTDALGYKDPCEYFDDANALVEKHDMDLILGALLAFQKRAKEKKIKISKEWFAKIAQNIEFYNGVEEYFNKINEYGKRKGICVEHYIISSGHKEVIDATPIAKYFKVIYGSFFAYDENGEAFYPAQAINSNNKVQFLFRIEKNAFDYTDEKLNKFLVDNKRFPFNNMVYIGDGYTDIPCMKVTKDNGGTSIAVYNSESKKAKQGAEEILKDGRVSFVAPADYSENSELFNFLKGVIDNISSTK